MNRLSMSFRGRHQRKSYSFAPVLLLALSLITASRLQGQSDAAGSRGARSNKGTIMLSATLPSQLRLSLSNVDLDVQVSDPAQRTAVISVPVTSSWVLGSASNSVDLIGFFDSPAAALTDDAGHAIPTSHVLGGLAADDMVPFAETSPAGNANASRVFFRQTISRQNVAASRSDTLKIQVSPIADLGAPAGEYRGVLHLRLISY
jgi:hypothetical protein